MDYSIVRTDRASDHLYSIAQYIADDSGSVDIARSYIREIDNAVERLATTPYMGSYPRYSIIKRQGYRVLIVRRHLIFYKVYDDKKQVVIHAVVDARQEYRNLI